MENEIKTNELVKDVELNIFALVVEKGQNNKCVKITMTDEKGMKITHKPTTTIKEFDGAFQTEREVQPDIKELPSVFFEIAEGLKKDGKVKVKATYSVWNKEVDGNVTPIRYVRGNMIKAWEVI